MLRQGSSISQSLMAASVQTATGTVDNIFQEFDFDSVTFELFVAAVGGTTPTLDMYIQTLDNAGNYHDCVHFTQLTGNITQANAYYATVACGDNTRWIGQTGSKTIAAGTVASPLISRSVRCAFTIGGTGPTFTITVNAYFNHQSGRG